VIDKADTAWMMAATALVLLMTPALGLFYAGLVREKNTLNTFMMCIGAIAIALVTWCLVGYSLAFDGDGKILGGLSFAFLHSPSRRPSASSPRRWCPGRWSSACASSRS
jgi:Amt family ammonium transporter